MTANLFRRAVGKGRRVMASHLVRRPMTIRSDVPLISFTFDDVPLSACEHGGRILEAHGVRGTYYLSLGLLATTSEIGPIAGPGDVARLVERGHELGCHTFDHCDAWDTNVRTYVASVDANKRALASLLPGQVFASFAYPKNGATWAVKPALAQRFACCRGGGQTFNAGTVDSNLLSACFIDRRARISLDEVRALIDQNAQRRGWLIFAAHDISGSPAAFSCTGDSLEAVVRYSVDSGAAVMPVAAAHSRLQSTVAAGDVSTALA